MLLAAQAKGKTMRKGCVGLCTSKDLKRWESQQPLYAPRTNQSASECPDIFQWGDWWYLTYSVYTDRFVTLYRKARSPRRPWITPDVDTFDTRCFYAAKHAADGTEHLMYGWNPTREKNLWDFNPQKYPGKDYNTWDWGGTMIAHKLIQQENGDLTVTVPEAVDQDFAMGYYLNFEPRRGRVQYKTGVRMYEDGGKMFPYEVEQERPMKWETGREYKVRVFVQGSILLLYVDDQIALGTRMLDRSGRQFGLFVSDGSAAFRQIRLWE